MSVKSAEDGRFLCQAVGCEEPASIGNNVVEWEELEIGVRLCPRHARALRGELMKPADPRDLDEASVGLGEIDGGERP